MAECRLCLEALDEPPAAADVLTDICACRGTQRFVHVRCLEQWQMACLQRQDWWLARHCSVCRCRLQRGLPWGLLPALVTSAVKTGQLGTLLWLLTPPLPVLAFAAVVFPLYDVFNTSLLLVLVVAFGVSLTAWQGLQATLFSMALFVLLWALLLTVPQLFQRQKGSHTLWAAVLVGSVNSEAFSQGAWWGQVADGGWLHSPALRSTGSSLLLLNGTLLLLYGGWTNDKGPDNALWCTGWQRVRASQRVDWSRISMGGLHLSPPETYGQTLTHLGGQAFLVLGGHTRGGYRGASRQWRLLDLDLNTHSASWRLAGEAPLGLAWHTATLMKGWTPRLKGGFVFVFGGASSEGGVLGSVLIFSLSDKTWQLDPGYIQGAGPPPRCGHTATLASDGRLWIVGGTAVTPMPQVGEDLADGIWAFDPSALAWEGRTAAKGLHAPRQHTAVFAGDALVLFGGGVGGSSTLQVVRGLGARREVHAHNPRTVPLLGTVNISVTGRAGTEPMLAEVASAEPPPLRGHSAVWTGEEMVVFGGSTSESVWEEYNGMLVMRPV